MRGDPVGLPMNIKPEMEINGTAFMVGLLTTRHLAGVLCRQLEESSHESRGTHTEIQGDMDE